MNFSLLYLFFQQPKLEHFKSNDWNNLIKYIVWIPICEMM